MCWINRNLEIQTVSPLLLVFLVVGDPHNRSQWVNYVQVYMGTPSTFSWMQAGEFYPVFLQHCCITVDHAHSFGNWVWEHFGGLGWFWPLLRHKAASHVSALGSVMPHQKGWTRSGLRVTVVQGRPIGMIKSTSLPPQGLLLTWLKIQLVASGSGCSPSLSGVDWFPITHHTPINSPPTPREKCANLASAKHPVASTNGWLFWVITTNISVSHRVTKAKFKETTTMT